MTHNPVVLGMLASALAYALFTGYDTTIKYLSGHYPIFTAMFFAFLVAGACIYGWTRHIHKERTRAQLKIGSWKLHGLRGGAIMVAQLMYFSAIPHIPLTEFYIILFIIPIIVALLAVPFLQEKITPVLVMALVASFAGILLALLPQQGEGEGFGFWHLLVLLASVINASSHIVLRKMMARGESREATALSSIAVLAAGAGAMAALDFGLPGFTDFLLIVLAGLFYAGAGILMPIAFKLAPASLATPPAFLQLIYGAVAGYLVFEFVPPVWTYLGGGVVILANLYLLYHQRLAEKKITLS